MSVFLLEPVDRLEQEPFWEHDYNFGGVDVTLRLTYSDRLERWYADLFDVDGEPIWAGKTVASRYTLGFRHLSTRAPDGIFWVSDTNEDVGAPTFEDLGRRILLSFVDGDDLPTPTPLTDAVAITPVGGPPLP